jgi:hypothetical protein
MKNSVKAMDRDGKEFQFLQQKSKINGIFIGTQIKHAVKDKNCNALLKGTEKAVWEAFKVVVDKFLGKHKAPNYRTIV